jgi:hypothetical protein
VHLILSCVLSRYVIEFDYFQMKLYEKALNALTNLIRSSPEKYSQHFWLLRG